MSATVPTGPNTSHTTDFALVTSVPESPDNAAFALGWGSGLTSARTFNTEKPPTPITAGTTSGIHARLSTAANVISLPCPERRRRLDTRATSRDRVNHAVERGCCDLLMHCLRNWTYRLTAAVAAVMPRRGGPLDQSRDACFGHTQLTFRTRHRPLMMLIHKHPIGAPTSGRRESGNTLSRRAISSVRVVETRTLVDVGDRSGANSP